MKPYPSLLAASIMALTTATDLAQPTPLPWFGFDRPTVRKRSKPGKSSKAKAKIAYKSKRNQRRKR